MKKALAMLLTLVLVLSIVPQSVFASAANVNWKNETGDTEFATIRWGYNEDGEFKGFTSATSIDTSGSSVDLNVAVDGYYYVSAMYKATEDAAEQELVSSALVKKDGAWTAQVKVMSGEIATTETINLAGGSLITVYYAPGGTGSYEPPTTLPTTAPTTEKNVTDNGDGTYTIQLDITGHEDETVTKIGANVIIVMDVTQSMTNTMPGETRTRMDAAKVALNALIDTLNPGTGNNQNLINFTSVNFGNSANYYDGVDWTTTRTAMEGYVSGLNGTEYGTCWQAGLQGGIDRVNAANNDANLKNNQTYVIFVTDGNPNGWVGSNGRYNQQGSGQFIQDAYDAAVPVANTLGGICNLYGVFVGDADGLTHLRNLITGANGKATIDGSTTDNITQAFKTIAQTIVDNIGAGSVVVDDGVPTLSNVSANVAGEAGGFEYYITTDKGVTTEWEDHPGATYDSSNGVTWDLSQAGTLKDNYTYTLKFTVWPSQAAYDLIADLNNGIKKYEDLDAKTKASVSGNASTGYTLNTNTHLYTSFEDTEGNEYKVSTPYDEEAMPLPSEYFSIYKEWSNLLPGDNRYAKMLTNSDGNLINTDGSLILVDGQPIHYSDERAKDNAIYYIDLIITSGGEDYTEVRLTSDSSNGKTAWLYDKFYVAPGSVVVCDADGNALSKNAETGDVVIPESGIGYITVKETGHDYSVKEKASDAYYWELHAETYHPMVINGEARMLILVAEEDMTAAASALANNTTDGTYYNINGSVYTVVKEQKDALITAENLRRSYLNLTKAVTGDGADADELFKYTITMDYPDGKHSGDTGYNAYDDGFWFSVRDADDETVMDLSVTGATAEKDKTTEEPTGYWYFDNGGTITLNIKAGWNVRFTNLFSGTTYEFTEDTSVMSPGFSFDSIDTTAVLNNVEQDYEPDVDGATISGEIETANTVYTITYNNTYALKNVVFYKKWDDNSSASRPNTATFAGALSLQVNTGSGYSAYALTPAPTITVTEDSTANQYKITVNNLPASIGGKTASYRIVEDTNNAALANYEVGEGSQAYADENGIITNARTTATLKITKSLGSESASGVAVPDTAEFVISGTPDNGSTFANVTVTYAQIKDGTYSTEVPAGTYSVTEDEESAFVAGYTITVTGDNGSSKAKPVAKNGEVEFAIINTYTKDTATLKLEKVLGEGSANVIPDGTTFTIHAVSTVSGEAFDDITVKYSELADKHTFTVPTGTYSVSESGAEVDGYTLVTQLPANTAVAKGENKTLTVTNTYTKDTATLKLEKVLGEGSANVIPDSTTFTIHAVSTVSGEAFDDITVKYSELADKHTFTVPTGTYSVSESGAEVDGYTLVTQLPANTAVAKGENKTLTVTNTYTLDTAKLKITKAVSGTTMPDEAKFVISGTPIAADQKFTDVTVTYKQIKDGKYELEVPAGKYTVTEDKDSAYVEGYTLTVSGDNEIEKDLAKDAEITFAITNAYAKDTAKLKITKSAEGATVPDDAEFVISGTPTAADLVFADTKVTYKDIKDGKYELVVPAGKYTVTETKSTAEVAGYTLTVGGDDAKSKDLAKDAEITFAITNTYTMDTATLKLTKTASGLQGTDVVPDSAKFVISGKLISGEEFEDIELTYADIKDGKWSKTVPVGEYTVKENGADVIGYTLKTEYSNEVKLAKGKEGELSVKNTYTRTMNEITVTKVWIDEDNKYGVRPESVKFTVTGSDKATYDVTLKGTGNTWTATLSVPEYTNGVKNTYTVDEEKVTAGYAKSIKDLTITNTFKPCWGDPPVKKVLDGDKPTKAETFTFKLTAVSTTAEGLSGKMPMPEAAKGAQEMTMDVAAGETKEFGKFDLVKPGVYTYTITEVAGETEGYSYSTEKHTIVYTVTTNEDNSLKCVKTVDGAEIDAEKETAEENVSKFTFTNEYKKPVVSVNVSKVWEDNNNEELTRPESIKVKLLADGKDTGKTLELSKATDWAGTFEDLDKYDADGKEIKYTVDEAEVPEGYSAVVSGDATKGFVITNSVVPPTGDTSDIFFWSGLSMTSLLGLGYLFLKRRKEEQ